MYYSILYKLYLGIFEYLEFVINKIQFIITI